MAGESPTGTAHTLSVRQGADLQAILDVLPAWVFFKDAENLFHWVNRAFAEIMQMSKEQLEGTSLFDIYPREEAEAFWRDDKEVIAAGKPSEKIIEPVTLGDGVHWVQTEKLPLRNEQGDIIGIVGFTNDITDRKKMEDEIRELAMTDQLTGLSNRRGFFARAEDALRLARRLKLGCLLIGLDIDGLKGINDAQGHLIGDDVVVETACVLRQAFRESDIIARVGGDEFLVLALDASPEDAEDIALRIGSVVDAKNSLGGRDYALSFSYGMAFGDAGDSCSVDALISRADALMYAQKRDKRRSGPEL